jgi:hypothetical protein
LEGDESLTPSQLKYEAESLGLWLAERGISYEDSLCIFALAINAALRTDPRFPKDKAIIRKLIDEALDWKDSN